VLLGIASRRTTATTNTFTFIVTTAVATAAAAAAAYFSRLSWYDVNGGSHRYFCTLQCLCRWCCKFTDCTFYCCTLLYPYLYTTHTLQQRVTETLVQHVPTDSKLFERLRDVVRRDLQSFDQQQPYYHAIVASALCLEEPK
jgi:hypothetical protein